MVVISMPEMIIELKIDCTSDILALTPLLKQEKIRYRYKGQEEWVMPNKNDEKDLLVQALEHYKDQVEKEPLKICDGCNVNPPWEHKCHGNHSVILGKHTKTKCECKMCKDD